MLSRSACPEGLELATDRVIRGFHCSLRELPDQPTRAAGVNLIYRTLGEFVRSLDELSGIGLPRAFRDNCSAWRERQDGIRWDDALERRESRKRAKPRSACP